MGYTHYFPQGKPATEQQWAKITSDFKKIVPLLPIQRDDRNHRPPPVGHDLIFFNGKAEDGHETMVLEPEGSGFQFCKTARKPYDKAVVALLILANHHAPGVWEISSDGDGEDWLPTLEWLNAQGLGEFKLPAGI